MKLLSALLMGLVLLMVIPLTSCAASNPKDSDKNDLDEFEEQLGKIVAGQYYTLNSYGTEVLEILRSKYGGLENVPAGQVFGEETGYSKLAQFRLRCEIVWRAYYEIPATDERLRCRRDNPYLDATLYFWEQTRTIRSEASREELMKLFEEYGGDNLRMHWRGLPEIPDRVKFLPE